MKKTLVVGLLFTLALILPMASAVDVRVTVIDKYGDEISSAEVNLTNSTGHSICSGITDSNGRIAPCALVEGGNYSIAVTHDDYKPIDDGQSLRDFDGEWFDVGVVMRPKGFSLNVTVGRMNADCSLVIGDFIIEGATVIIESLDRPPRSRNYIYYDKVVFPDEMDYYEPFVVDEGEAIKITDSEGKVVVRGLEFNTEYRIMPSKEGYGADPYEDSFDFYLVGNMSTTRRLIANGNTTYKAIVWDNNDEAIAGANVTVTSISTGESWTQNTNLIGRSTFILPTPGCYNISISKEGYCNGFYTRSGNQIWCEEFEEVVCLRCEGSERYDQFRLYDFFNLEIGVRGVDGPFVIGPVNGANVTIVSINSGKEYTKEIYSSHVRFYISPPDCFNITVSKAGFVSAREDNICIEGNDYRYIHFELYNETSSSGSATFTATVRDQDSNEPIEGASVIIERRSNITGPLIPPSGYAKSTDADGKAVFTLATPACYDIAVSKEGYSMDSQTNLCFNNDGAIVESPYFLSYQGGPISPPMLWNDTITLIAGVWKLISVPYELVDSDVNAVFPLKPPIGTGDDWVLRYNGTAWENPSMTIDPLKGYWVKSDTNATIELEYAPKGIDDLFPEIELKQGWNMIGHTEDKVQSVPAALYSLYDNGIPSFEIVYRWDGANWEKYIPGVLEEFNWLYPGEGYWIKMKEDRVYTAIDMNTVV